MLSNARQYGKISTDDFYNLSIYCHCMNNSQKEYTNVEVYSDEYLVEANCDNWRQGWKRGVTFGQLRLAWLFFVREMFKKTFPASEGKNILPKESEDPNNGQDFSKVVFNTATKYYANLICEFVFKGFCGVTNPKRNDKSLRYPRGCDERVFIDDYIKFPGVSGTINVQVYYALLTLQFYISYYRYY